MPLALPKPIFLAAALFTWLAVPGSAARADLTAEHLLLIINRNEPRSRELAEYYQRARQVPEGRILELDLPTTDQIDRAAYEQRVVREVRKFLISNSLREKVRSAVTFYGVPLIVGPRTLSVTEQREKQALDAEAAAVARRLVPLVQEAERIATSAVGYRPPNLPQGQENRLDLAVARLEAVEGAVRAGNSTLSAEKRAALATEIGGLRPKLEEPFAADASSTPLEPLEIATLLRRSAVDPEAREALRQRLRARGTLRDYASLLHRQQALLGTEQSDACFDSELALLWFDDAPAAGWIPNPLARGVAGEAAVPILMTSRLDGRDPQQVRDLIAAGIATERQGLEGSIVVDSRGIPAARNDGSPDGYGVFDERLRGLAGFLRRNTALKVVHDDRPEVIAPPGERGVAVYVGWYSLTSYVRAFDFERGAVGYHVASFEMRSLRNPDLPGWVRGLLDDGVVATCGPVSEPFLHAFPPPDEFVPLLLTGQVTLGEAYWRTVPLVSWKMGLIGDPLYRPFAAKPALQPDALPAPLRLRAGL